VDEQELVVQACFDRDLKKAFLAFANDPLVTVDTTAAKALFDEMVEGTGAYLGEYL
jgi:alpha-galactosidase